MVLVFLACGGLRAAEPGARPSAVDEEPHRVEPPWQPGTVREPFRPVCKTAEELREACKPLLRPYVFVSRAHTDTDIDRLFIVDYLGSEDRRLRDEAAEILAELIRFNRPIRATVFREYLSKDDPMNVRVIALAYSICGRYPYIDALTPAVPLHQRLKWEDMKDVWAETLNDVAEYPVPPPHFEALARTVSFSYSNKWVGLLKPENRPVMFRRLLALLSAERDWSRRRSYVSLLSHFSLELSLEELLPWYSIEPDPRARAAAVILCDKDRYPDKLKMKPLMKLAAQDPDPEVAREGKRLLRTIRAQVPME